MKNVLLATFPSELLDQMVSFDIQGEFFITWREGVIEKVIHWAEQNKAAIFGGCLFERGEEGFFFTGLEWNVERDGQDWSEFVQKSAKIARSYLHRNPPGNHLYFYALNFITQEEIIIRNILPENIPDDLIRTAYSLHEIGCAEVAWKYEDAIHAIHFFANNGYRILGGDVYEIQNGKAVPTADSWYYQLKNQNTHEDIIKSRDKAIIYIENYHKRNGEAYYYTPVIQL